MINEEIKKRLVLALDVEELDEAKKLVDELSPYIGTFKVGLQLFCGYGLEIVNYIKEKNADFFLDVKLHDIPNTVEKASYNVIKNGANFFNVHATGGIEMMKAAKKGALKAAEKYSRKKPLVLAVTVLTSINQETLTNELSNSKNVEDFRLLANLPSIKSVIKQERIYWNPVLIFLAKNYYRQQLIRLSPFLINAQAG